MEDMPKIHLKGTMSDINVVFRIWNEKVKHISLCYKNSIEELEKQVDVSQIIKEKANLINRLNKEDIRLFIERETDVKIRKIKIARIIFDFAEPEDGPCSVDLYLNPGRVFGGFGVHLRLHGDEPRIEMCGLS